MAWDGQKASTSHCIADAYSWPLHNTASSLFNAWILQQTLARHVGVHLILICLNFYCHGVCECEYNKVDCDERWKNKYNIQLWRDQWLGKIAANTYVLHIVVMGMKGSIVIVGLHWIWENFPNMTLYSSKKVTKSIKEFRGWTSIKFTLFVCSFLIVTHQNIFDWFLLWKVDNIMFHRCVWLLQLS